MTNPELRFSPDGRFRIVQFTDTHFREDGGDAAKEAALLSALVGILDVEQPGLVVFTGDVVTGRPAYEALDALLAPVIERGIPWAVVLGNHDDEYSDRTRKELIAYLAGKPFSLTQPGPEELGAAGNYVVPVASTRASDPAAILYFLDSGAYTADRNRLGFYAWVPPSRIEWYRRESRRLTSSHGGIPFPALAFFHIPLPEYREAGESPARVGQKWEGVCAPELNSGLFTAFIEAGDVMGTFVGHDHDNDFVAPVRGIGLAYGRKTGTFSYLKHLQSGARVIELQEGQRSFTTWVRTAEGAEEQRVTLSSP